MGLGRCRQNSTNGRRDRKRSQFHKKENVLVLANREPIVSRRVFWGSHRTHRHQAHRRSRVARRGLRTRCGERNGRPRLQIRTPLDGVGFSLDGEKLKIHCRLGFGLDRHFEPLRGISGKSPCQILFPITLPVPVQIPIAV